MKNVIVLVLVLLFSLTNILYSGQKGDIKFKNGKTGKLVSDKFKKEKLEVISVKGMNIPTVLESLQMSKKKDLKRFKQKGKEFIKVDNEYYYLIPGKDLVNPSKEVGYCVKCRSKRDFKETKSSKKGKFGKLKNGKLFITNGIIFKKLNLEVVKVKGFKPSIVLETKKMNAKKDLKPFKQKGIEFVKVKDEYYQIVQKSRAKEVGYCVKCRSKRDFKSGKGTVGKLKNGKSYKMTGKSLKSLNLEVVEIRGYKSPIVIETLKMSKKKSLKQFKQNGKYFIKIENEYYEVIQQPDGKVKDVGYCIKCRSKRD